MILFHLLVLCSGLTIANHNFDSNSGDINANEIEYVASRFVIVV
jgi:hypothetical protein